MCGGQLKILPRGHIDKQGRPCKLQLYTVTCMKIQELNKNRALLVDQKPSLIVGLIKSRGSILKFIFRSQIYRRNSSGQARASQARPYLITTVETTLALHV